MNNEQIKLVAFYFENIDENMRESDYQRDFYESLRDQFEKFESLSAKQIAALTRIYERVTR